MRMTWGRIYKGGKRYGNRIYPRGFSHARDVEVSLNGLRLCEQHDYVRTKRYIRLLYKTTKRDLITIVMGD